MSQLTSREIVFFLAAGSVITALLLILQLPLWVYPLPATVVGMAFIIATDGRRQERKRRSASSGCPAG